ncbi:PAS domain S-box protein [Colwellia sp. M166]|uniref:MHYT domain-containing protein n=1 Tax=Colwellia sp. M166 TaxID=2583805 RepID=UPI00211E4629|nr:MHYT domain-containing protein [Colwellia sp. M166]UUO25500.1 PAS domain S-box protein [Colwellia sp. M166]|tara:strand:- start:20457 stop:23792 length:3336 start_codon:yes stop_codon:yes gene_type:complete
MQNNVSEIFQYSNESLLTVAEHDPWLVLLSISIAIFASFMGFQVASQAANRPVVGKHISLLLGSFALGGGVWSMHFIGMLALELCTDVSYKFDLTALSVLPAIAASWVALNLITRDNLKALQLIIGGILVGAGIGTMHYVGMAAMEMAVLLRYDLLMFCISILVAVILAILSLWISFGLGQLGKTDQGRTAKMLISSCVMGAAISGMHYTGMSAARFVLPPGFEISQQTNQISWYLAFGITVITVFIIGLVLAANLVFGYKDRSAIAIRNEKRLMATMDTAVDGIITINASGIIISVNKAVTTILGWQETELLGNNVSMIVPAPFKHHHDQYLKNYIKTRIAKIIGTGREVEAIAKCGEEIPVRLGIGHVEFNNEHMFVAFISDLRERREMEAELRKNEARIRALLTNIPGIAYRCIDHPGWPNLFINDEVEKVLGYPAVDFLLPAPKRSLGDFIHPDDIHIIEETNLRASKGYQIEFRFVDRYGTIKWMLGYGRAIKEEGSSDYYLDGFIMDISDRKKMESELISAKEIAENAAESRSAFLANMSHEIRTPMNAVIGFSDILLDDELSDSQRKHLNTINQSAKSLLHILNDVLDSAKLDKGKFQLEYRDFSLVEEVDAVVSTLWLQAQNKGLELALNIHADVQGYYNGVPDRIRQVLTNLIGNAIKFTEHGKVSIEISNSANQSVTFIIKDSGIGMTASQLETIFDAFAQADESMSRRFGGTGLGTTISKQLVELMEGSISATSVEGEGTEFTFKLPLKPVVASTQSNIVQKPRTLPELHILVVDDIDHNIDLLTLLLKRHGHKVIEARDGEQALLQMKNNMLDVVLMDIQMPVMDGLTAAKLRRKFEAENKLIKLPIIALTASVLPRDRLSAEQAGMDGFANKPIDMQQLNNEISNVLALGNEPIIEPEHVDKSTLIIDVEKGIALWGSKTSLFAEISRFIKQTEREILQLESLLEQQEFQQLQQQCHKFKGGAGNLALNRFMTIFDALEQSSHSQDIDASTANIGKVITEFHVIKNCVSNMSSKQKVLPTLEHEHSEASLNSVLAILLKLAPYVNNNEFNEALLEELYGFSAIKSIEIDAIIDSCNNFEFSQASEQIKELIAAIKPTL